MPPIIFTMVAKNCNTAEFQERLYKVSLEVIRGCALNNGAIVAADSDRLDYPNQVQNYRYVWPRDAAYLCVAANRAGIRDFQEEFWHWLSDRAEGFSESGLLYQNYYVNGPKRWLGLQIDQNGSVLWAIEDFYKGDYPEKIRTLVKRLADGILSVWSNGRFSTLTQDLWEERYAYPELKQFHTYSLAACIKGLRCASSLNSAYQRQAQRMETILKKANKQGLIRTAGKIKDDIYDASLLGLVWPFEIYSPDDPLVGELIGDIERKLTEKGGVHRYPYDLYDGYRRWGIDSRRGSGTWPLLNFWLALVLGLRGEHTKAQDYADYVIQRIDDDLIPEQLFDNDIQTSVKPLGWSHAMYVLYRTMQRERSTLHG